MRDKNWNKILKILCLTILADGKVYKEEVDTFLVVAKRMNTLLSTEMILTEKMLLDWFSVHRDDLAYALEKNVRGPYLTDQFCTLDDPKITGPLLQCMVSISRSDDNFHNLEVTMVERAAQIWGWSLDDLKDKLDPPQQN